VGPPGARRWTGAVARVRQALETHGYRLRPMDRARELPAGFGSAHKEGTWTVVEPAPESDEDAGGGGAGAGGAEEQLPATDSAGRVVLNCPFSAKEECKALGARWDMGLKRWVVPAGTDPRPFKRWWPPLPPKPPPPPVDTGGEEGAPSEEEETAKRSKIPPMPMVGPPSPSPLSSLSRTLTRSLARTHARTHALARTHE